MPTDPPSTPSAPADAHPAPGHPVSGPVASDQVGGHATGHHGPATGGRLAILTLTALGVVYGDIGTSPLYSIKECFSPIYGLTPTRENVFGILSLIVWALTLVITVKYVSYVLRADNRGEGGTFALLALIVPRDGTKLQKRQVTLILLALFGASLLYGDGIITPAMSVLGALEGLEVATPALAHFVVPLTIVILGSLFSVQRFGTDLMGKAFGPIMLLWFVAIGWLGLREVLESPWILGAVNPLHAARFVGEHGLLAFLVLGSVVLVITGGEALYADMGHFGKRPIRLAWLALVFPALLLNYFGQGALLVRDPSAAANPFFLLAPKALLIPLLVLATLAAIVASQAMISGAYSVTRQGIALGYIPRLEIRHTSQREEGQIYIPEVNWFIAVGCLVIVLAFQETSRLGAAYGIAVTGTMLITSILFFQVVRQRFQWALWQAVALCSVFVVVDLLFFSANVVKVLHGGWVPLALGVALFVAMATWKRGRALLVRRLDSGVDTGHFVRELGHKKVHRVPGTAVFMTGSEDGVPPVLLHHLKHNQVLHERVVLLSVKTADVPEVPAAERVAVQELGMGVWRVVATYGFMQSPSVPAVMARVTELGVACPPMRTTYYLGRERLIPIVKKGDKHALARWRKVLYAFMARNARSATDFFGLPPNRVVELGTQLEF
jgi:KUP system potassium uptake protein